jgi:hypothetical protein
MSFYSAASAQVGTPPPPTTDTTAPPDIECIGGVCGSLPQCSSADPDCVCVSTTDGLGLCSPGALICAALDLCPDGNCPPGSTCAVDTCCGEPVCIPIASSEQCPPDPVLQRRMPARVSTGPGTVGG